MVIDNVQEVGRVGLASSHIHCISVSRGKEGFAQLKQNLRSLLSIVLGDTLHEEIGGDILVSCGEVWTNASQYELCTGRDFTVVLTLETRRLVCELEWGGDPEAGWLESAREAYIQRYRETKRYDRQDGTSAGLGIRILDAMFQGGVTYRPEVVFDNGCERVVGVLELVYLLP